MVENAGFGWSSDDAGKCREAQHPKPLLRGRPSGGRTILCAICLSQSDQIGRRLCSSGSKVLAEYAGGAAPSAPTTEFVYSGGSLLATLSGANVTYRYPDHLSNRLETNATGTTVRTFGHLPFGETWYETGTADKWKFTGYERDASESGLDTR
jgi:hypothetical protein